MENATKALLMAAGILIAIMTISALVLMYNRITEISKINDDQLKTEQLVAFNQEFEAFNRKDLYGSQIISVMNKMLDNNEKYRRLDEPNYEMEMSVTFVIKDDVFNKKKEGTIYSSLSTLKAKIDEVERNTVSGMTEFKRKIFKCTSLQYNEETGRVNKMTFEEIDPNDPNYQIKKQN